MEMLLALMGLGGLVLIAAGAAFYKWGESGGEVDRTKDELKTQKKVSDALARRAPRGLGLRKWMRDNSEDDSS